MRSYSCLKHIFPSVWSSVWWLSECGRGRQRQADTLASPYGTFCTAIGVSLHDPDCHWLVMKASRAEADPSLWGMEAEAIAGPGGPEGASGGVATLLPVTHHAPLHDRQPCLACAQWEVWVLTVWAVVPHSLVAVANTEEGQQESKHSEQTLVLYRPWKTSQREAAEWWISALFPIDSLSVEDSAGFGSWEQDLTVSKR